MMKVETTIKAYEVDGKDTRVGEMPDVMISKHWNKASMVVITINGKSHTVVADELRIGVDNATRR